MAWSAENAIQAYLQTLSTGNGVLEPDAAEFVSAMAAGSCARLMVEACAGGGAGVTTLALVAAARQTGGRVVCIVRGGGDALRASAAALGAEARRVELVAGDARELLSSCYAGADFVLVDCAMEGHGEVFRVAQARAARGGGGLVVGYNALYDGGRAWRGRWRTELLPIGEGLWVSRVPAARETKSRWVVRVDEDTGEEHVFRVGTTSATSAFSGVNVNEL